MLYQVTTVLYETSKPNKVQLCMERSHHCKQHHLECVNIPETVNNSMRLYLDFQFFEMFCTNKLAVNDDLLASKSRYLKAPSRELGHNYNSRV